MQQSFYFYANPHLPGSEAAARALCECLIEKGASVYAQPWLAKRGVGMGMDEYALPRHTRCMIAFGGDGTLLRAAPLAAERDIPLLGVHTGTVGFLMHGDPSRSGDTARLLLGGDYPLQPCPLLRVKIDGQQYLALNDVTLTRGEHPGVIRVQVEADGQLAFCAHGDGAVISTPLGATAYSLAAGGPIVRPDTKCLLAAPICARELLLRPVVLPLEARLALCAQGDPRRRLQLAIDGQILIPVEKEIRVEVELAAERLRLLVPDKISFFQTLRLKQRLWNQDEQE